MMGQIKINGIYGPNIIEHLKELGVYHWGFDFRPKSFNFLQQYRLQEILQTHDTHLAKYFLHFCQEKDHVIEAILKGLPPLQGELVLEFSDQRDAADYDQFEHPFLWHLRAPLLGEAPLSAKNLQGIVLSFDELAAKHRQGDLYTYLAKLQKLLPGHLSWHLELDWDADVFPSLFEFCSFKLFSMPINHKVESSYRHVDFGRFKAHIGQCKNWLQM